MDGDLAMGDFYLAEQLHMTVEQMHEHLSNWEYVAWRAFNAVRNAKAEVAAKSGG